MREKYDSVHGQVNGTIAMSEEDGKDFLIVNVFHEGSSYHRLRRTGSYYVYELTGIFTQKGKADWI